MGGTSAVAATPTANSDESADRANHHGQQRGLSPQISHTKSGPTGYEVTFRYLDPNATGVQIRGEWGLRSVADATTRPPSQYQPGDFFNEAQISDMALDAATGVWSWTTPLPPGTWSYQFLPVPVTAGSLAFTQDPANPTFNQVGATSLGSYEPLSQVYVPQDQSFSPDDRSVQAPARKQGTIVTLRYTSPGSTTCTTLVLCASPAGEHDLTVYTPPGYDANRRVPYPTLYLSHGGGGNEIDWPTQGASRDIIDNLIGSKTMQPAVVVTTAFNGMPSVDGSEEEGYARDLLNNVIPTIESQYNVSDQANDRAFAGLSAGGGRAGQILFNYPTTFGYYGIWSSTGAFGPTIDMSNPDARTRLALHVGIGTQDPRPARHEGLALLATTDIPFTRDDVDGVHSWDVWRQLMAKFASDIAFAHTTTAVTTTGRTLTAAVTPSTTEPAALTGNVQFSINGAPVGKPVPVRDGEARLANRTDLGNGTVTASYSGDRYYSPSTGEGTR